MAIYVNGIKVAGGGGGSGGGGEDGVGISNIQRTAGDGSPGATDTYTISLTDGSAYTFTVYNGADGDAAGTSRLVTSSGDSLVTGDGDTLIASISVESGTAGVSSFNGRTGAVTPQTGDYTAAMVGALPDTTVIPSTAADVGALPDTTVIPSKTSELTNDSGFVTMDQVTASIQSAISDSWEASY